MRSSVEELEPLHISKKRQRLALFPGPPLKNLFIGGGRRELVRRAKQTSIRLKQVSAQLLQFPAFVGVLQIKPTKKLRAIFPKTDNCFEYRLIHPLTWTPYAHDAG